MRRAEIARFV